MKYSPNKLKKVIQSYSSEYEILGFDVSSGDNNPAPYYPVTREGDIVVTLIGNDPGSVSWHEIIGNVFD